MGNVSRAAFFATKDIEYLEELTFNYDWKDLDNRALATVCHCQSKDCKGTIQSLKRKTNKESENNAAFAIEDITHDLFTPMKKYTIKQSIIPLGFKNEKNSCYIDSALHMLFSIPLFMTQLANYPPSNFFCKSVHTALLSLYEKYILKPVDLRYLRCGYLVTKLNEYIMAENKKYPNQQKDNNIFSTNLQSDSHEFLIKLIDSISDQSNVNFMDDFFQMKVEEKRCVCCYNPPTTYTNLFKEHTLPIFQNASIDGLLKEKFAVEESQMICICGTSELNYDRNSTTQGEYVLLRKFFKILKLLKILILRIMREN